MSASCFAESVVVDSAYVYWTEYQGAGVVRAPIGGGPSTVVAPGQYATGLAIDAHHLYWSNQTGGTVMKLPIAGGTPITLAAGGFPMGVAIDETRVCWTDGENGLIQCVPKDGGPSLTIATGQVHPNYGIAVDGTNVYWVNAGSSAGSYQDGGVMMAPIAGAPAIVTTIASGNDAYGPNGIAVDATSVYWTTANGHLMKAPIGGGTPTMLATSDGPNWGIALDGDHVYWTRQYGPGGLEGLTGAVFKVPKNGGCTTQLAIGKNLLGITVDADNVYWADCPCPGKVAQIAKE